METTFMQKTDAPPCDLQQRIDDKRLGQEIRRGLITIARAFASRYSWGKVLLIVLGVEG